VQSHWSSTSHAVDEGRHLSNTSRAASLEQYFMTNLKEAYIFSGMVLIIAFSVVRTISHWFAILANSSVPTFFLVNKAIKPECEEGVLEPHQNRERKNTCWMELASFRNMSFAGAFLRIFASLF
jgi:magnesium-transporting ATPase (P-type)